MTNFKQIDANLFIGPQPEEHDLEDAKKLGIRTVIDMRMPGESNVSNEKLTMSLGLGYVNVPVDKTALADHQIDGLDQAMERFPGPYLLHCATGARAALLLSLSRARRLGWTAEHAFQDAHAMGFNLEDSELFATFVRTSTAR